MSCYGDSAPSYRHFINSSITLAASLSKLIESITAGDDYGKNNLFA
jgi:hypothetical protein